ncbi:MAG: hypothetical protein Ct9H300mP24_6830 [Candidatus Neomarinimicrobiota bacterium]|nr:MAG: hypothetical protein Ct9H300mP24_6830 [Candidatus Neomarinimicrobiota bacterium]
MQCTISFDYLNKIKNTSINYILVLSVFASSVVMEKMLLKSFLGYAVSFVFAWGSWWLISKYILYEGEKGDNKYNNHWRVAQWLTTGWLWATWLKHDMANIMVFLPRYSSMGGIDFKFFVVGAMLLGLGFMFYERGGKKTRNCFIKNQYKICSISDFIDLVYCFVLYYFKEVNNIPMRLHLSLWECWEVGNLEFGWLLVMEN